MPASRAITGNLAMPGFTAPKLLWVRAHEPDVFARVRRVLLPKDWLRLRMTGDAATDCSDASGTLWLDVAKRAWSPAMLAACGLDERRDAARLRGQRGDRAAARRGRRTRGASSAFRSRPAAGDQAAGAVGAGVVRAGEASLALGTSGVLFVAGDRFQPNPARAVHAFCHCLPGRWHQMSVLLSAASCLAWVTRLTGAASEAALLAEVEAQDRPAAGALLFLPYLSGERTPHNDPAARGVFFGLSHDTDRATLARAVLEGVAFAFADAQQALLEAGAAPREIAVRGRRRAQRALGADPGGGARRAARRCAPAPTSVRRSAPRDSRGSPFRASAPRTSARRRRSLRVVEPDPALRDHYRAPLERFRALYARLRPAFAEPPGRIAMSHFPDVEPHPLRRAGDRESARVPLVRPRSRRARQAHGGPHALRRLLLAQLLLAGLRRVRRRHLRAPVARRGATTRSSVAEQKIDAAFEFIHKLGAPFFCFHDRDVAPEGETLRESHAILDRLLERVEKQMARTGTRLLWGTANLFGHPRYAAGAATNPDPEVFAYAAAQVKHCLEATQRLAGANYVLWGGREGYETLLNTDLRRELDQLGRFLALVAEHKHKIGFGGTLLIEPKPFEPTKHQYDFDAAAVFAFLQKYGLESEFKLNIEVNHATLAGHDFQHEVAYAIANGIFGAIDANRGDARLGWDTDQFPNDAREWALVWCEILRGGGLHAGGFNFDAKLRRQSVDATDLFHAHVGGMDAIARGLLAAAAIAGRRPPAALRRRALRGLGRRARPRDPRRSPESRGSRRPRARQRHRAAAALGPPGDAGELGESFRLSAASPCVFSHGWPLSDDAFEDPDAVPGVARLPLHRA